MPSIKKCQAEQPAHANQVGRDFLRQPATSDNPSYMIQILPINCQKGTFKLCFKFEHEFIDVLGSLIICDVTFVAKNLLHINLHY